MAVQLAIVSVTTADLGVAYFLLFQFSMRSILQLWLWITFYFWGAVCWANKRAVNSVRHSEHVSRGEKQCITINSPYWAFHCPPGPWKIVPRGFVLPKERAGGIHHLNWIKLLTYLIWLCVKQEMLKNSLNYCPKVLAVCDSSLNRCVAATLTFIFVTFLFTQTDT